MSDTMSRRVVVRARRYAFRVLVAGMLLVSAACGKTPEGKDGKAAAGDGIEESWTGNVSKLYSSSLDMGVSAAKTAAQKLNLRVQNENAGFMKRTLDVGSDEMTAVGFFASRELYQFSIDSSSPAAKVTFSMPVT